MIPELQVIPGGQAPSRVDVAAEPDELRLSMDLDSEAAVLSSILNDESLLDEVRPWLREEHFYSDSHRRMYEACCIVRDSGTPLDVVTMATVLRDNDRLPQVGGMQYVTTVLNSAPVLGASRIKTYAISIRDKWVRRETRALAQTFRLRSITEPTPIEIIIGETREHIDNLTIELGLSEKDSSVNDVLRRTAERLGKMANTGGKGELPTGFDRYDSLTGGLTPMLHIVAARPGMGKTGFATAVGVNVAARRDADGVRKNGVYMASLETFDEEAMTRLWCAESWVDVQRARTGMLSPQDWTKLTATAEHVNSLPMWIDDESAQSVSGLWGKCRRADMMLQRAGKKLKLVIVDYIQLLKAPRPKMSREEIVSENARALVAMANDMKVCVLALAQLNRECEKRPNKRPQLSDLRESGEIEQAARLVTFLYRDEVYNKQTNDKNIAELIVAKQNNGPTDTVRIRFDGACTRFDNLAEEPEPEPAWVSPVGTNVAVPIHAEQAPPAGFYEDEPTQAVERAPRQTELVESVGQKKPSKKRKAAQASPLGDRALPYILTALKPGVTVGELRAVLDRSKGMMAGTVDAGIAAGVSKKLLAFDGDDDDAVVRRIT